MSTSSPTPTPKRTENRANEPSPASVKAQVACDVIDGILVELEVLPDTADRLSIRSALEAASAAAAALQRSTLGDHDHFERLEAATQATGHAGDVLSDNLDSERGARLRQRMAGLVAAFDACRAETIDALVAVQLVRRPREDLVGTVGERLSASEGEPRLHRLGPCRLLNARLGATIEETETGEDQLQDELESPEDDELEEPELDDELELDGDDVKRLQVFGRPLRGADLDVAQPKLDGEVALVTRLLRDCLEELGSVAQLRLLRDRDRYDEVARAGLEQRLLADLDAVVALGEPFVSLDDELVEIDVLAETLRWAGDDFVGDPRRGFARAFVLGCAEGEDAIRAAVMGMRQSPTHTVAAQAHALSVAPNPGIAEAMRRLCRESTGKTLLAAALDVLHARRVDAAAEAILLSGHDDAEVRRRAVRNLAACARRGGQGEAATEVVLEIIESEIDEPVLVEAMTSLLQLDEAAGLKAIRDHLDEEKADPGASSHRTVGELLCRLGLAGASADTERLQSFEIGGTAWPDALGFHGDPAHVPVLLAILEKSMRTNTRQAAAHALLRITGAPMQQEQVASQIDFYDVTTDSRLWAEWWAQAEERFEPGRRHRLGQPHTPVAIVDELARPTMTMGLRRMLALELAFHGVDVNVEAFAVRQRAETAAARATLTARAAETAAETGKG